MESDEFQLTWSPDTVAELRFRLTLRLAPNYMSLTTGDATSDAVNAANRLKAAVDAVIAICPPVKA